MCGETLKWTEEVFNDAGGSRPTQDAVPGCRWKDFVRLLTTTQEQKNPNSSYSKIQFHFENEFLELGLLSAELVLTDLSLTQVQESVVLTRQVKRFPKLLDSSHMSI